MMLLLCKPIHWMNEQESCCKSKSKRHNTTNTMGKSKESDKMKAKGIKQYKKANPFGMIGESGVAG